MCIVELLYFSRFWVLGEEDGTESTEESDVQEPVATTKANVGWIHTGEMLLFVEVNNCRITCFLSDILAIAILFF